MQQLALDVKLADYALLDTFHAGPNAAVLDAVKSAATVRGPQVVWIWGGQGSGRSHLLQAAVAAAAAIGESCAWLPMVAPVAAPLAADEDLVPGMLEGMGALDLLCVDDVDVVAGDSEWERQLFRMFEELRNNNGRLLVTASMPTHEAPFLLKDLASRLASGPTWRLQNMSDQDRLEALQLRSRWRGLDLPDETGRYLLRRVARSSAALFAMLDDLDLAALTAQRRLTVPFVKSVLEART
jgi:DnaA family protein